MRVHEIYFKVNIFWCLLNINGLFQYFITPEVAVPWNWFHNNALNLNPNAIENYEEVYDVNKSSLKLTLTRLDAALLALPPSIKRETKKLEGFF